MRAKKKRVWNIKLELESIRGTIEGERGKQPGKKSQRTCNQYRRVQARVSPRIQGINYGTEPHWGA